MTTPALLLIDLQKDFFDPESGVGHIQKAIGIPGALQLLRFARQSKWTIIHVITEHSNSSSLPTHLKNTGVPPYCLHNSEGARIVDGFLDVVADQVVVKQEYSGFRKTNLEVLLQGISTVVLAGIATDCCILHTANDAASLGKHVYVPYQAVSASGEGEYTYGLLALAKSCGSLLDLQQLLTQAGISPEPSLKADTAKLQLTDWFRPRFESVVSDKHLHGLSVDLALEHLQRLISAF